MLKKFAVLAAVASFVVACGPSQEDLDAIQHAADSVAAVLKADSTAAADAAAAAAAEAAAAAAAAMDSTVVAPAQ